MKKIKVLQQYMNVGGIGGLKTEYDSLCRAEALNEKYDFQPMVLDNYHDGINLKDISFYYGCIKHAQPDIIHIRGAGVESLNAVLAAKAAGCGKILVTVHGMFSDLVYYNPIKRWLCKHVIERAIFTLADGISCVCRTAHERKCFDKYRKKMLPYVYNRIPSYSDCTQEDRRNLRKRLCLPDDAKIGLYVGRITKEKGLEYLLDALRELDGSWPEDFILMLVGDGDYAQELKCGCAALKNSSSIIFCGAQADVSYYLLSSDFFIQPSLHENLSIAILEACAARLPCLATDVGGNGEIIDDGTVGMLVEPGSSSALVKGIKAMCDDELRLQLKRRIESYDFSSFSNSNVDSQLDSVYEKLMTK